MSTTVTALLIVTTLVTKLLVINPLMLHPALKSAVSLGLFLAYQACCNRPVFQNWNKFHMINLLLVEVQELSYC